MTDSAVATLDDIEGAVATIDEAALLERVVIVGDLSKLKPDHRVIYYREVCRSLGLNPLTRPFQYIVLNGKLTLYATRTATDQLRRNAGIDIDSIEHSEVGELYIATVHGRDRTGRRDSEVGAVNIANLKGDNRANAIMKAITKAKRRLTLSLAGLGWLDDSEVGSMPDAEAVDVDPETGAIEAPRPTLAALAAAKLAGLSDDDLEADVVEIASDPGPGVTNGHAEAVVGSSGAEPPPPEPDAGARPRSDRRTTTANDQAAVTEAGIADGPAAPGPDAARSERAAEGSQADVTRVSPTSPAGSGADSPAEACTGFHPTLGKCVREDGEGHEGNHRNKDRGELEVTDAEQTDQAGAFDIELTDSELEEALEERHRQATILRPLKRAYKEAHEAAKFAAQRHADSIPTGGTARVGRFRITKRHVEGKDVEFSTADRDQLSFATIEERAEDQPIEQTATRFAGHKVKAVVDADGRATGYQPTH